MAVPSRSARCVSPCTKGGPARSGCRGVSLFLAAGHFFVPFWLMLSRERKRNPKHLAMLAAWILFAHWVDDYWLVMPFLLDRPLLHLQDLLTFVGIGGPAVAFG